MQHSIIITAAGMSTRQKSNKLLMKIDNKIVIEKTIETFINFDFEIIVVLGHQKEKLEPILLDKFGDKIIITINAEYKRGISLSLKSGLLVANNHSDYYWFCNGDKPFIKTQTIKKIMANMAKENPKILVPRYRNSIGHPTIFHREIISNFFNISGDVGGIQLINENFENVSFINVNDRGIILDMDRYLSNE